MKVRYFIPRFVVGIGTLSASAILLGQSASTTSGASASATASSSLEPTGDGDVTVLSPFQVTDSQNKGYQATSTMSGTRLNTNLEDLGASISVVTKQQLIDTAAVDINDVFKYELSTEGTSQWTNFNVDRGLVTDGVQTNPSGSTRMRGLTAANIAVNGFTSALPLDTYNVEAIEISRGPNSIVFGLGGTGGGINIIKGKANPSRDRSSFTLRGDTYDGYRSSFDLNRVLIPGKAAIRVFGLHDEVGYVRKPSKDTTRRVEATVTLHPFKTTSIYASFESYRNENSRPNALTPRDTTTDWVSAGKPTWDPTTQIVHFANGTSVGPVSTSTTAEASLIPYGLAVTDSSFANSPSAYFDRDGRLGLLMISRMPATSGTNINGPLNVGGAGRLLQSGNFYVRNSTQYPLYNSPQISDKRLYDWGEINLAAPNFGKTKGESSSILIEQNILKTSRQSLALQAAWIYERISTYDRRFLGTGGASLQPYIDVNEKLLDGTPNPYFLRTYVGGAAPSTNFGRNHNESYRGTLAYELDLTHEANFVRWFGLHRFMGFAEYRTTQGGSTGYVDAVSSTNAWMNGTPSSRNSTSYRTYPRYYVGDASGQNVDYAPARAPSPPYTLPLRYYNATTQQWINDPVTYDLYYNAGRPNKRILSTQGAAWQGYFWNRRIVPLLTIRKDFNRSRDSNSAINPTVATNGYFDLSPLDTYSTNDWVQQHGKTTSEGVVFHATKWLSLAYSQSNVFNPGSAVYDVWGVPLPDPFGKTKDYGFELKLFHDTLRITAKQYETVDIGRSTSELNTIVQRAIRMDRRSSSGDPGLTDWYIAQLQILHSDWDQTRLVAEALSATGADYDYLRSHINRTHGDASNSYSRGKEIEVTYNPTKYWRNKLTASQSTPLNGRMSPAVQNYIDSRMPTWTTIKDPVTGNLWWTTPESNNTIPRDFYIANVLANLKLAIALQGKRRAQTREWHLSYVTMYDLAAISSNRWLKAVSVGGSLRWEDKAAIGYRGAAPDSDGIVREYDPNKPVWQKGNTYVDLNARYRFRMFHDRILGSVQLNVQNAFETGHLQAVAVNPDGRPWAFRIIDPVRAILTVRFDL